MDCYITTNQKFHLVNIHDVMKNKSIIPVIQLLLIIVFSLLFINKGFAQDDDDNDIQRAEIILLTGESADSNKGDARFLSLIYDLHPTIFINNNTIKNISGVKQPVCLIIDPSSFNFLSNRNDNFSKIEVISINIKTKSDLNQSLDLSKINGFNKLKYIYVSSAIDISSRDIESFIKNSNDRVTIYCKKITQS